MEAIVIGVNYHNALGVILALGRDGVNIAFYVLSPDRKESYVAGSRYVSSVEYFLSADKLGDALLRCPQLSDGKEVILCCHGALVAMLDRRQREFENGFLLFSKSLPNPNSSALDVYKNTEGIGVKIQTTVFEENVTRSAGDFFEFERKSSARHRYATNIIQPFSVYCLA